MPNQQKLFSLQMQLEGCQICEEIGSSNLGPIYRLYHPVLGNCALKYLEGPSIEDKEFLEPFFTGMKKIQELEHPNIAKIYRLGLEDHVFVLRELVLGTSIQDELAAHQKIECKQATQIVLDVAMALLGGYPFGLVYKNIKPGNIILSPGNITRLVDISLPPTNPLYLAPEIWEKKKSDVRSDIYALGIVYYQMITGTVPYSGTHEEIKAGHLNKLAPIKNIPSDIPADITAIIQNMLEKNLDDRYHSPLPLIGALREALKNMGVEIKPIMQPPVEKKPDGKKTGRIENKTEDAKKSQETNSKDTSTGRRTSKRCKQMFTGMMATATREESPANASSDINNMPTRKVRVEDLEKAEHTEHTEHTEHAEHAEHAPTELDETVCEEVYLSKSSLDENLEKAFSRATFIQPVKERIRPLPRRVVHFPKVFAQKMIDNLQKAFRRECWLLKQSDSEEEMEVEIDLEQAYLLRHFYHYEDQLQAALVEEENKLESDEKNLQDNELKTINLTEEEVIHLQEVEKKAIDDVHNGVEKPPENLTANIPPSAENSQSSVPPSAKADVAPSAKAAIPSVADQKTIGFGEEEMAEIQEESKKYQYKDDGINEDLLKTFNDYTLSGTEQPDKPKTTVKRRFSKSTIEVSVDFGDAYQTMGWVKFCREHNLKKGVHFEAKQDTTIAQNTFVINLMTLESYQKEQDNIIRIKEFFQADYEINELDRGGMGVVLKLTAKNDPTILSLRPENYWARQRFAQYLRVVKDANNNEIIYANIPKGTEFVVKIAFEGHEESLIQEGRIFARVVEDPHVCNTIIGAVQQGRLFTLDEKQDQTRIGYYVMLEYAAEGNAENLYHRFPDLKLSSTVAFCMMYGMAQTLQKLKRTGIIHRDIKPHNILIDDKGIPKLSDFGLAITTTQESGNLTEERRRLLRVVDENFLRISSEKEQAEKNLVKCENKKKRISSSASPDAEALKKLDVEIASLNEKIAGLKLTEEKRAEELKGRYRPITAEESASKGRFEGSVYYAAPEQFETERVLTHECDVYQLGAVMFTMLTGKRPVEGKNTVEVMSRVLYPEKHKVTDKIKGTPLINELSELIHEMMAYKPEERIEIDTVKEEMDRLLFEHAKELKELPVYTRPSYIKTKEQEDRWKSKVNFAQELHKKCIETIFSVIFQNQELPSLGKDLEKIVFFCPQCHKKLHIYRHMDGKKGKCPSCKKAIIVQIGDKSQTHRQDN